ncbi:MAG: hypothetical protein AAFQ13_00190 [Pseudomonadota bacterium]
MKYPNRIQAAVLLDARFEDLDEVSRGFVRLCEMKSDAAFTIAEHHPNRFVRLTGGSDNLMVSFEYVNAPPAQGVLEAALNSPVTSLLSPGLPERVAAAPAHILLEVSPSVIAAVANPQALQTEATDLDAHAFHQRLDTLSLMVRMTIDHTIPCAVHWTQSDQLLDPETFEGMATIGFPGPLAIHPRLFGVLGADDEATQEDASTAPQEVGILTFGAAHWLGRELRVAPSPVPWTAAYETLLAFCKLATTQGGYIIPDGDTFGPEDGSEVWRIHHREAEGKPDGEPDAGPALYELVPLRHDACHFIAEDFAKSSSVLSVRQPKTPNEEQGPEDQQPEDQQAKDQPNDHSDIQPSPGGDEALEEASLLAELKAALEEGRAEAAANPPEPLPPIPVAAVGTPSLAGAATVSGRSLRARVFGGGEA